MKTFILICLLVMAEMTLKSQIIHVPGDYPKIQLAINAATPGATILVDPGTYYEQINFLGKKPLTVASKYFSTGDTNFINNTIIDGSQISNSDSGSIVYFISGEDTTSILCGFTITNGNMGTIFYPPNGGELHGGGAIYTSQSGAKILSNHIVHNRLIDTNITAGISVSGAGIQCSNWTFDSSWVVIEDNIISNNQCRSDGPTTDVLVFGTGICAVCNTRIINNVITENRNSGFGLARGGGAGFFSGGELYWPYLLKTIGSGNVISNNICEGSTQGGTAVIFQAISAILTENEIENNIGGGTTFWAPKTGSAASNNHFTRNTTPGDGCAIEVEAVPDNLYADTLIIENSYFIENRANRGGSIGSKNNPVVIQNNVFSENHASLYGGAIYLVNTSMSNTHAANIINNTFANNSADALGESVYSARNKPLFINCIIWNDTTPPHEMIYVYNDTAEIAFCDIDTALIWGNYIDGGNNKNVDPMFINHTTFQLQHYSNCIDNGAGTYTCRFGCVHHATENELSGYTRPVGAGYDMGAYDEEFWNVGLNEISKHNPELIIQPNPFETSVSVRYFLPSSSTVLISVYDNTGRWIAQPVNEWQSQGKHEITWNTQDLPAGMYYVLIRAGERSMCGKMMKR